jgi:hypothetical protein
MDSWIKNMKIVIPACSLIKPCLGKLVNEIKEALTDSPKVYQIPAVTLSILYHVPRRVRTFQDTR